jgi:4-amino-4-deoxy-L-arabinose transferase-like glycosyltransferase
MQNQNHAKSAKKLWQIPRPIFRSTSMVLLLFIFSTRIATFLAFPNPSVQPDSSSYKSSTFPDFSLVSFSGDSVRAWPTTLLFALAPNNSVVMLLQMAISAGAWSFLGITLLRDLRGSGPRLTFSLAFLVIACSPQLIQWETVILGQSLMISTLTMMIALAFRFRNKGDSYKLLLSGLFLTSLFLIQKSSNILLSVLFLLIFTLLNYRSRKVSLRVLTIFISLALLTYSVYVGNNINKSWSGTTYSGKTILWHLGGQSPAAYEFVNFLEQSTKAPNCLYADAPFANIDSGVDKVLKDCQGVEEYLSRNSTIDLARFLISNPVSSLKMLSIGIGAVTTDSASHYGKAISLFPNTVNSLFFGSVNPDFRFNDVQDQVQAFNSLSESEPIWIYSPALLLLILAFAMHILCFTRRNLPLDKFTLIVQFGLFAQILVTFLIIPSEWVRSVSPYFLNLLVLSVYTIVKATSTLARDLYGRNQV